MIEVRPFSSLGHADHGWLNARHHFSFAQYRDPQRMHWGLLRVWNDDEIQPGTGFPPHSHADMEIITYVREGAITHEDSLGNKGRTVAGDVQIMSAGTGIQHSEFNLEDGVTRIFQIWIIPTRRGLPPSWGTKPFPRDERIGQFVVLASGHDEDVDALRIQSDARVLAASMTKGDRLTYEPASSQRFVYLVTASGNVRVNGHAAGPRDGVAVSEEDRIEIIADTECELILVDTASPD